MQNSITTSVVQVCFDFLELLDLGDHSIEELCRDIPNRYGIETHRVLPLISELGLVDDVNGHRSNLAKNGKRICGKCSYQNKLIEFLLIYVETKNPSWIRLTLGGRRRVLAYVNPQIRQLFSEAELDRGFETGVVKFWDTLSEIARGKEQDELVELGRQGERLTVEYEQLRTGCSPKWIAIDLNDAGYDVLSVLQKDDFAPLRIEVKTSRRVDDPHFFLTKNEWEVAISSGNHIFHLWHLSPTTGTRLARIPTSEIESQIPIEAATGKWTTVKIPYFPFETFFSEVRMERATVL